MNSFVVILLVMLVAVSLWNFFSLNRLKRLANRDESPTADAKYYELKYNIQFLVGMSAVLIAVVGILGYKTMGDVKNDLSADAKISVDSMKVKLKSISDELESKEANAVELNNRMIQMASNAKEVEQAISKVKSLEAKIKGINDKNILKQNYYIVPSISYSVKEPQKKFYFKDLPTNTGDRLPEFRTPPLVFATQDLHHSVQIFNITTESFEIVWQGFITTEESPTVDLKEPAKFSLLVIEK